MHFLRKKCHFYCAIIRSGIMTHTVWVTPAAYSSLVMFKRFVSILKCGSTFYALASHRPSHSPTSILRIFGFEVYISRLQSRWLVQSKAIQWVLPIVCKPLLCEDFIQTPDSGAPSKQRLVPKAIHCLAEQQKKQTTITGLMQFITI